MLATEYVAKTRQQTTKLLDALEALMVLKEFKDRQGSAWLAVEAGSVAGAVDWDPLTNDIAIAGATPADRNVQFIYATNAVGTISAWLIAQGHMAVLEKLRTSWPGA
jgi:hypothetical protein